MAPQCLWPAAGPQHTLHSLVRTFPCHYLTVVAIYPSSMADSSHEISLRQMILPRTLSLGADGLLRVLDSGREPGTVGHHWVQTDWPC